MIKKIIIISFISLATCTGVYLAVNKDIFSAGSNNSDVNTDNSLTEYQEEKIDTVDNKEIELNDSKNEDENSLSNDNSGLEEDDSNKTEEKLENEDKLKEDTLSNSKTTNNETVESDESDENNTVDYENESSTSNPEYDELADSMLTDEDFHVNEQGVNVYNDFDWDNNSISDQDAEELQGWNVIGVATEEAVDEYISQNN